MKTKFRYFCWLGKIALILGLSLTLSEIVITPAQAAFTLSVQPYDRAFDLKFSKLEQFKPEVEKEVTVTVNSDIGKRYQIVQDLQQPLMNMDGAVLPQQALAVYTLRGSSTYGTLNLDSALPVRTGRSVIYTSDATGRSDSFTLVYVLNNSLVDKAGLYRGRLYFFLEPIDSTQRPVNAKLDVEVEIEIPTQVELTTPTGSNTVRLEAPSKEGLPAEVRIAIQGQRNSQYKILQLVEPPTNSEQEELTEGVYFSLTGGTNGVFAQSGESLLRPGETVLYTSSPTGSSDEMVITYHLQPGLQSGRYRGNISYYITQDEVAAEQGLVDRVLLDVEIKPVLEMKITPEYGGGIEFKDVKQGQVYQNEVVIEFSSNLAKPYQVNQNVLSLLTNKQGATIPMEYFKFSTQPVEEKNQTATKGNLKYPTPTAVQLGETVIFVSNPDGDSDRFKLIYELSLPRDQQGGDYTTAINYSLAQTGAQ